MEKKVYGRKKTSTRYHVVYGCSRADESFSTLRLARQYIRQRPNCVGCPFYRDHEYGVGLYKEVISNTALNPFVK